MKNKPFKTWHLVLLLAVVGFSIVYKIYRIFFWPNIQIKIADQELRVLVADTQERKIKGLGGRKSFGKYGGMIFPFSAPDKHGIVMRDMKFPIDIFWIANGKVVDIAPNVQPEHGKSEAELMVYWPRVSSTLVLEMPAGAMRKNGFKIGDIFKNLEY
ncbi:MAG: DUF192 domain-containing protein [Patescibacteria group bacterium]